MTFNELRTKLRTALNEGNETKMWDLIKEFSSDPTTSLADLRKLSAMQQAIRPTK